MLASQKNHNTDQDISIFELMDDLVKVTDFTKNHIIKDENPCLTQINQVDEDKQDADFDTNWEDLNQIVLKNGINQRDKEGNFDFYQLQHHSFPCF